MLLYPRGASPNRQGASDAAAKAPNVAAGLRSATTSATWADVSEGATGRELEVEFGNGEIRRSRSVVRSYLRFRRGSCPEIGRRFTIARGTPFFDGFGFRLGHVFGLNLVLARWSVP